MLVDTDLFMEAVGPLKDSEGEGKYYAQRRRRNAWENVVCCSSGMVEEARTTIVFRG